MISKSVDGGWSKRVYRLAAASQLWWVRIVGVIVVADVSAEKCVSNDKGALISSIAKN